jgi:hypothetical protein
VALAPLLDNDSDPVISGSGFGAFSERATITGLSLFANSAGMEELQPEATQAMINAAKRPVARNP